MTARRITYGNGPARAKTLKRNRKIAEHVRETDDRDVGIRNDMGELLGFGDPQTLGGPEADPFAGHTYFAWLR